MPSPVIVAFQPVMKQPPIPLRSRRDRLRALPQFAVLVHWFCSAVLRRDGEDVKVLQSASIAPALRDQVEEETLRTLGALDPIAESVARRRARAVAGELLAQVLHAGTEVELSDPEYLQDRANVIADAVLGRYRTQLVYGGATTEAN